MKYIAILSDINQSLINQCNGFFSVVHIIVFCTQWETKSVLRPAVTLWRMNLPGTIFSLRGMLTHLERNASFPVNFFLSPTLNWRKNVYLCVCIVFMCVWQCLFTLPILNTVVVFSLLQRRNLVTWVLKLRSALSGLPLCVRLLACSPVSRVADSPQTLINDTSN